MADFVPASPIVRLAQFDVAVEALTDLQLALAEGDSPAELVWSVSGERLSINVTPAPGQPDLILERDTDAPVSRLEAAVAALDEDLQVELYSELCNAIEQGVYGPYDDDFMHTSKEARAASNRVIEVLEAWL